MYVYIYLRYIFIMFCTTKRYVFFSPSPPLPYTTLYLNSGDGGGRRTDGLGAGTRWRSKGNDGKDEVFIAKQTRMDARTHKRTAGEAAVIRHRGVAMGRNPTPGFGETNRREGEGETGREGWVGVVARTVARQRDRRCRFLLLILFFDER